MSQGKLRIQRRYETGGYNALVEPTENPHEWFFIPLPTMEYARLYAAEFDLDIIEEYEDDNGDQSSQRE